MQVLRHLLVLTVTALGVTALFNCGGAISEAPACPAQLTGTCHAGDVCSEPTSNSCGVTVSVTCHCDSQSSQWTCDAPAPCKPPVDQCPPNGIFQGDRCSVKGAQCDTHVACAGGGLGPGKGPAGPTCTCDGFNWQCPDIQCPPPPTNPCPPPGSLHGGEACFEQGAHPLCMSGQPYFDCNGNVQGYADCTCDLGRWNCANIGMPFCPDAGPTVDAGWVDGGSKDAAKE
jgi:hypothetical protein